MEEDATVLRERNDRLPSKQAQYHHAQLIHPKHGQTRYRYRMYTSFFSLASSSWAVSADSPYRLPVGQPSQLTLTSATSLAVSQAGG